MNNSPGQPLSPCYIGPEPFVFVSYSHQDASMVYPEIDNLFQMGCRVWYDQGIKPSSDWNEELANAIQRCRLFLAFLSPHAVASEHVRNEINYAASHAKPILAIHLAPHETPASLALQLGRFQAVIRYNLTAGAYRERLIQSLPPESINPSPPKIEPRQPAVIEFAPPPPRKTIPLPSFHYGSVVPPDYFIDREDELSEATRLVQSGHGFLLVGNRRAGKTSFCTKLIHEIMGRAGNDILAVYLNLQQCTRLTPETFLEHTLLNVVGEMARQVFRCKYSELLQAIPAQGNERLRADRDFIIFVELFARIRERTHAVHGSDPSPLLATEFVQLTQDLLQLLRGKGWRRCAIFYDESNRLPHSLSVELLGSNEEALNAAGVTSIYAASPEMDDSFAQLGDVLGHHLRLGPFRSPDDMRRLLVRYYGAEAGAGELPAEPAALARLWELSQGRPYFIQLLAGGGFKRARGEMSAVVGVQHVNGAHEDLRKDKPHLFS